MISLSALMLSSLLLTADADATHSGTRQAAPAKVTLDDKASWRPSVIALSTIGGAVVGGAGVYLWEYPTAGSLNASLASVVGVLMGGLVGGLSAAGLTSQWGESVIAIVPTAGGRETGGLHVLVTF